METTEVIIARLVLGYLREEKCRTAHREFLKSSEHLHVNDLTKTKYLPTRFTGLSLNDIVKEYIEISRIVQGRLEATNFYNECYMRTSLIDQLLYLLNSKVQYSRTSTPCPRSPVDSNLNGTSPSHADHVSDVETTPAHTLPGNVRCSNEDPYLYKTPRRKSTSKLRYPSLENQEVVETSSTTSSTAKDTKDELTDLMRRTQKGSKPFQSDDEFNESFVYSNSNRVEQQNEDAIRSIVAQSNMQTQPQLVGQNNQPNNEITVFNGSLDKYLTSNTCNANTQTQPLQNPLYINTTGSLLMVPSTINSNKTLQVDTTQQYYLVNKQSTVGSWDVPTVQTANVLTEQDILAMPTVIVNDERQHKVLVTQQQVVPTPVKTEKQAMHPLIPKPVIGIPAEYFYSTSDIQQQGGLRNVVYPKTRKKSKPNESSASNKGGSEPIVPKSLPGDLLKPVYPQARRKSTTNESLASSKGGSEREQPPTTNVPKSLPGDLLKTVHPQARKKSTTNESSASSKEGAEPATANVPKSLPGDLLGIEEEPSVEVTTAAPSSSKVQDEESTPLKERAIQKTPKSGSHVRNLDFSSPPKITSTQKKPAKSKKEKETVVTKKPAYVHKKQAAKALPSASSSTSEKEVETTQRKNRRTWDTDLRANIEPGGDKKPVKKKKTPVKKGKKMAKTKSKQQLNTTEDDAARIEAALQTPIKNSDQVDGDGKIEDNTVPNSSNAEKDSNKTVLSPSKLNASKRKLISMCPSENIKPREEEEEGTNKFITPEMSKSNFHFPIKANRNITSMFETPLKNDGLPITPGLPSPNTSMTTPFTKMLQANLKGIDIASMQTPNIPVTPNFPPFTPNIDLTSPFSNRATDYSTNSSYYQPSDSELNRSLEADIVELEKQPAGIRSDVVVEENVAKDKKNKNELVKSTVDVRLKIFNGSVIGKKNLSLVKRNMESDSSSSSDSSSEDTNDEADSIWIEKSNQTVICNKKATETPKRMYSLRNRNTTTNKKEEAAKTEGKETPKSAAKEGTKTNKKQTSNLVPDTENNEKNKKSVVKQNKNKETKVISKDEDAPKKVTHEITPEQADLKAQLNEKLKRTLNKIKSTEKATPRKTADKTKKVAKGKFKIRIVPNTTKNKRKPKTEKSPKKSPQKRLTTTKCDSDTAKVQSGKTRSRTNSTDTNTKDPLALFKDVEKTDKSASDVEAQNLIEGLKERGIHLMKNKTSPCKKTNGSCNVSECEKEPDNEKANESNRLEISTSELETDMRETYDTKTYEGEDERLVFSELKSIRSFESYDMKVLEKKFIGKVFIEDMNEEVEIPLVVSPFYSLLDIPSTGNVTEKENNETVKESDKVSEDLPVNQVITKKTEPDSLNPISKDNLIIRAPAASSKEDRDLLEPPSTKKRKIEKEETRVPEEKDCKTLLQQINVDTFLNNIYGNNQ